jgi:hypothetical protein
MLLMIATVCGAVVGGMVVAVFMAVAFVAGVTAGIGVIPETERLASGPAGGALSDQSRLFGSRDGLQISD